jgi:transcriptional regulator NrdR family protein
MNEYDFSEQAALLEDAKYILEDYGIDEWSFGGGTALSCYYYNHRMSYDIDIFTEDRSSIQKLIDYKENICEGFGISIEDTEVSSSGITFILSDVEHQLKLDFVESGYLTSEPFIVANVLGLQNIKIQTPLEIVAKKIKHRKNITIRDCVDFAFVEKEHDIISKIKKEDIVDLDRFIDVYQQFISISDEDFNNHLEYLKTKFMQSKDDIKDIIYKAFNPKEIFSIAIDDNYEVLAVDEWVELYEDGFLDAGEVYKKYNNLSKLKLSLILGKSQNEITYTDIINLSSENVKEFLEN